MTLNLKKFANLWTQVQGAKYQPKHDSNVHDLKSVPVFTKLILENQSKTFTIQSQLGMYLQLNPTFVPTISNTTEWLTPLKAQPTQTTQKLHDPSQYNMYCI